MSPEGMVGADFPTSPSNDCRMVANLSNSVNIEDPEDLRDYLLRCRLMNPDETLQLRLLEGGVSNRAVWIETGGETWVAKQALEKLRVEADWYSNPERIHREALGLRTLVRLLPEGGVPRQVHEDPTQHILIMEAVATPHDTWKNLLLEGQVHPTLVRQFGEILGRIHRGAFELSMDLEGPFFDRSFFHSLRLEPYYLYTAKRVSGARDFLLGLVADTEGKRQTLVHGDYSPKNILVREDQMILLDHEVMHWGDPAFDLGFSLTHLLSKARHVVRARRHLLTAAKEYWRAYLRTIGLQVPWHRTIGQEAVRHTLGCLLARVEGRSTLEYLGEEQRREQREQVLRLIQSPPESVELLIDDFSEGLANDD